MNLHLLKPKKALNKAFLKVKPVRAEIEVFKDNLIHLLDNSNDYESEEFHKNLVADFLKDTYYDKDYFINTKGRNDLVIHNGSKAKSPVGVILETKKPTNSGEMMSAKKPNTKALQELVLYYLRERITGKNLEVKKLIITNIYEWFIFDASVFERYFAQNKKLVKQFEDFENGSLSGTSTDFFYKEIAAPVIDNIEEEIECTHFDFREYEKPLRNADKKDDVKLVALFKLLSPEHLLKKPFTNDSNSLDSRFYAELLHIIGLSEQKQGGKKVIERNPEKVRNTGSILEDAIIQIDSIDKLSRLDRPSQFGKTQEERLFNVGLELSITWINRILFLKLLEAQLISYHEGDKSYAFLNYQRISSYDDLNSLFFQVLARKYDERNADVRQLFEKVPYLNSSLFEPTKIEHSALFISNLRDDKTLPIYDKTVLKDAKGKRRTGELTTLEYLFDFLNAYEFSGEGSENIQEDNKTLINASVLGLIFEKINGYKDGSFFTPGFITMYMCRETIRKAVVQKFNETKNWECKDLDDVYNKIDDINEANTIVNSIKICDPAVGSGHFLVSALNEMIAVKNDLNILQDRNGRRLKEYEVEVVNDELIVTDEEGELFEYHQNNRESQRVQETLFHEKQTIIENCLFGVDINTNSVKICRLRLWIELLKNAYYKNPTELETLPNIDINIKCGNSLVSRFSLDADLKKAFRNSKWTIDGYRIAVATYRNAENKEQKREMEKLITDIKSDFRSEIALNDPKMKKLRKLSGELHQMTNQQQLFEMSKREKTAWNKKVTKLAQDIKKLEAEIEEIKSNKIYENAFEWRFEFPEVLNDEGDFVGFDAVIGNPPYSSKVSTETKEISKFYKYVEYKCDPYALFIERCHQITNEAKIICLITPLTYLTNYYYHLIRKFLIDNHLLEKTIVFEGLVFEEANVDTSILMLSSNVNRVTFEWAKIEPLNLDNVSFVSRPYSNIKLESRYELFEFISYEWEEIKKKLRSETIPLNEIRKISLGMKLKGNDNYVVQEKDSDHPDLIVFGKDINYFAPLSKNHYFSWNDSIKIGGTQNHKVYQHKSKILIQAIRNLSLDRRIVATIDENSCYFVGTVNGLTPTNSELDFIVDEHFLLAILNSNLLNEYFKSQYTTISLTAAFLGELPIKKANEETQRKIGDLVRMLMQETENPARTNLIHQIDQLVYQLYDLTEEEIEIVEGN